MIYRDCLGTPTSTATISVFGADYGRPGKGWLALSSVSDCPKKKWPYLSKDVTSIVAEMDVDGWECITVKDGHGAPRINCTHKATQALTLAIKAKSDAKFRNAERGYIRFGACPRNGRSFNDRDQCEEKGVSVFEAEFTGTNYRLLLTDHMRVTYSTVANRPAYRVYGHIVGTGGDGEPVLRVTRSVKL